MSEETNITLNAALDEKEASVAKREALEKSLRNLWGHSETGIEAKRAAMTMLSTKTGMYAKIPILCKADACPYAETCALLNYGLAPEGEYCPVETAQIELRYAGYENDFDLEQGSFTDRAIVSEIINADIMMERCKSMMAMEGTPVVEVVAGISDKGVEFTQPVVSKYWEAYERAYKKRNEAYQLMLATRKDKKGEVDETRSITEIIAEAVAEGDYEEIEQKPDYID